MLHHILLRHSLPGPIHHEALPAAAQWLAPNQVRRACEAPCIGLSETVKNQGKKVSAYALARVAHFYLHVGVYALQAHLDASSRRSELDGVREQVPDHLLQAIGIPVG